MTANYSKQCEKDRFPVETWIGDRLPALRYPQREGDKRKIEEDWYQIIQVFTSAYKTSTGASQCCALRDLIWKYINFVGERKKLKETLDSKTS